MSWRLSARWRRGESARRDTAKAGVDAPAQPSADAALERLSELYAERVEELDDLRRRLEEIGFTLSNHLDDPDAGPPATDDLKRVLELTRYDHDR
jgi:hypothetical protein